eukprot:TRINITY_DN372_c0_g1_i3.p1 TRINITY_DN372_c0_g1~~TRINITY_DN372_c0_g1_i3.p1  ORF type:complete len:2569 (-),score=557.14 TRINITY_DN372_c0_g1_i3:38-7744(-)
MLLLGLVIPVLGAFSDIRSSVGFATSDGYGICVGDWDGDGVDEINTPRTSYSGNTFYKISRGPVLSYAASLSNVIGASGLNQYQKSFSCAWADYNNDGLLDLMLGAGDNGPRLYRNTNVTLVEQTTILPSGHSSIYQSIWATSWADVNNDGKLDCFFSMDKTPSILWINNGVGFTDATTAYGLPGGAPSLSVAYSVFSSNFFDFDLDGDLDIYLTRSGGGFSSQLLRNNFPTPSFSDVTASFPVLAQPLNAVGACLIDYNNDGFTDIFVGTSLNGLKLYKNNNTLNFTDVTSESGLDTVGTPDAVACVSGDFDLDGDQDILLTAGGRGSASSSFFLENSGFPSYSFSSTPSVIPSGCNSGFLGIASFDYEGDGDLDSVLMSSGQNKACFLINDVITPVASVAYDRHIWVRVVRWMNGTDFVNPASFSASQRPTGYFAPLGVQVRLLNATTMATIASRVIDGGSSFGSQSTQMAHFSVSSSSLYTLALSLSPSLSFYVRGIQPSLITDPRNIITIPDFDDCLAGPCLNGGTCTDYYNAFVCTCTSAWRGATCAEPVNAAPASFNLLTPATGATFAAGTTAVSLTWQTSTFPQGFKEYDVIYGKTTPPADYTRTVLTNTGATTLNLTSPIVAEGTWYWLVRAVDQQNLDTPSTQTWSFCIQKNPDAPTLLGPSSASGSLATPTLSWSMGAFGVSCSSGSSTFAVYLSTDVNAVQNSLSSALAGTVSSSTLTFTPSTALAAGTYYWRVSASNGAVATPAASVWFFQVCDGVAPTTTTLAAPANASFVPSASVVLSWSAVTFGQDCGSGATTYSVFTGTSQSALSLFSTVPSTSTSITLTALAAGIRFWRVVATNKAGVTSTSATLSFTVCDSAAPAQIALSAPADTATNQPAQVLLTWSAPSSWGTACLASFNRTYRVFLDSSSTPTTLVASMLSTAQPQFTTAALAAGTYRWRVVADNTQRNTTSLTRSFTVCIVSTPTAPSLSLPADGAQRQSSVVTLSWSASSFGTPCGSTSQYTVYLDTNTSPSTVFRTTTSTTIRANTPLAAGTYYWRVVAANGATVSPSSAVRSFTVCVPSAPTPAPVPLFPTSTTAGAFFYNWTNVASYGTDCAAAASNSLTLLSASSGAQSTLYPAFRYVRFIFSDVRTFESATSVSLSEIRLYDASGSILSAGSATVTNPGGSSSGLAVLLDGSTTASWTDSGIKSSPFTSEVRIDFGAATTLSAYELISSSDASSTARDPVAWRVEGSPDAAAWTALDVVTAATPPTSRSASYGTRALYNLAGSAATALTVSDTTLFVNLPTDSYVWLVISQNAAGLRAVSPLTTFFVGQACVVAAPGTPNLAGPSTQTLSLPTPTLAWLATSFGQTCAPAQTNTYRVYLDTISPPQALVYTGASLSFSVGSLAAGRWFWRVGASNGAVETFSAISEFCVASAPAAPLLLSPTNSAANIDAVPSPLFWQTPASWGVSCAGYTYPQQYVVNFDSTDLAAVTTNSLDLSTAGLTPLAAGTHTWSVTASNGVASAASASRTFSVCIPTAPDLPSISQPADLSANVPASIQLSWTASAMGTQCGASGFYSLFLSQDADPLFAANLTSTSFQPAQPLTAGRWYWKLQTFNGRLWSAGSTSVAHFDVCIPSVPSVGVLSPDGGASAIVGSVALSWTILDAGLSCGAGSGGTTTTVYLSTSPVPAAVAGTVVSPSALLSPTISTPGTYYWSITVSNGALSASSVVASFVVCQPVAPLVPTLIAPANNALNLPSFPPVTFSWTANLGDNCGVGTPSFDLYLSRGNGIPQFYTSVAAGSLSSTSFSFQIPNALEAATWSWAVLARNGYSSSAASAPFSFTTCVSIAPSNPTLFTPTQGQYVEASDIRISWSPQLNFGTICGACTGQDTLEVLLSDIDPPTDVVASFTGAQLSSVSSVVAQVPYRGIYWVAIRVRNCDGLESYSLRRVVAVCKNLPPAVPANLAVTSASDVDGRVPTTVAVGWDAQSSYGEVCFGEMTPTLTLHLGTSVGAMAPVRVLLPLATQATLELAEDTTYFWALSADNGLLNTTSAVQNFTTIAAGCASLGCVHGSCDGTLLTPLCSCSAGWSGAVCASAICATSCGEHGSCVGPDVCQCDSGWSGADCSQSGGGANTAAVAAGVAVPLVLLSVGTIVGLLVYKRRQAAATAVTKKKALPDFTALAFMISKFPKNLDAADITQHAWKQFAAAWSPLGDPATYPLAVACASATQATELDETTKSILYVIHAHGGDAAAIAYINFLISAEIAATTQAGTLFRGNSVASKTMKFYTRMLGLPYLFFTLATMLNEICEVSKAEAEKEEQYQKSAEAKRKTQHASTANLNAVSAREENMFTGDFEIDPSKMTADQDAFTSVLALQLLCQKLLVKIKKSGDSMPPQFRQIFAHLRRELAKKFPEATISSIGGFMFLRFLNAAILLPESYGLTDSPPPDKARRQLTLVTKVLQNLSNAQLFGKKEEFMVALNPFIEQNQQSVNDWLLSLSEPVAAKPSQMDEFVPKAVPEPIARSALLYLYGHCDTNRPKVTAALQSSPDPNAHVALHNWNVSSESLKEAWLI